LHHWHRQATVVHKQLLTTLIHLPQTQLLPEAPLVVAPTKGAVAHLPLPLVQPLLPQQCQRHTFALQLQFHRRKVKRFDRLRLFAFAFAQQFLDRVITQQLQLLVTQVLGRCPPHIVLHGGPRHCTALGNRTLAVAQRVQAQDFSKFCHLQ
jgi:hypothetical protein